MLHSTAHLVHPRHPCRRARGTRVFERSEKSVSRDETERTHTTTHALLVATKGPMHRAASTSGAPTVLSGSGYAVPTLHQENVGKHERRQKGAIRCTGACPQPFSTALCARGKRETDVFRPRYRPRYVDDCLYAASVLHARNCTPHSPQLEIEFPLNTHKPFRSSLSDRKQASKEENSPLHAGKPLFLL